MGISIVAAAAVFFVVAGALLYLIIMYNELVRLRNDNDRAWANIDVLLKQRRDEIPEVPIDAEAVQQHEARAGAAAMQRDGRVQYHGRLSPDALSCAAKATALAYSPPAPAPRAAGWARR